MSSLNHPALVPWDAHSGRSVHGRALRRVKPVHVRVAQVMAANPEPRTVTSLAHNLKVTVDDIWAALLKIEWLDVEWRKRSTGGRPSPHVVYIKEESQ